MPLHLTPGLAPFGRSSAAGERRRYPRSGKLSRLSGRSSLSEDEV